MDSRVASLLRLDQRRSFMMTLLALASALLLELILVAVIMLRSVLP